MSYTKFSNRMADAARINIPYLKGKQWHAVVQCMLDVLEERDVGKESTLTGMTDEWINMYLGKRPAGDDVEEAIKSKHPYIKEGKTYLFGSDLMSWINRTQNERLSSKRIGVLLRRNGCFPAQIRTAVNGGHSTKSVWEIPGDLK